VGVQEGEAAGWYRSRPQEGVYRGRKPVLEAYCEMVKDDMERDQKAVQEKMEERKRLTMELMAMKDKHQFIIDTYNERISRLSEEIEAATSAPNFMEWWEQVQDEIELLRRQQDHVKQAVEQGSYIQKADAIRSLIDNIVCHWATVPTTDKRYKTGEKTYCRAVTITSKATAKATDGQPIEIMTIETPSRWSWSGAGGGTAPSADRRVPPASRRRPASWLPPVGSPGWPG
jgi:hypothetical protein